MAFKSYPFYKNRNTNRRQPRKIEDTIQIEVSNWLKNNGIFFTISPAGLLIHPLTRIRAYRMGYLSGTPDLLIFEPRGEFHGLFVELKTGYDAKMKINKRKQSDGQIKFEAEAKKRNYSYLLAYSSDEAITQIQNYLDFG